MPTIRMIRAVLEPGNRGPSRGMFALQDALSDQAWPWFKIGGALRPGDIPWIWSYLDAKLAIQLQEFGWPFIIGPNVLFGNSHRPGKGRHELEILDASCCVLQFTESDWYAALIQQHCNRNEAPIVIWRYPIDPMPDGPTEPKYDLLIYLKDMGLGREAIRAEQHFPRSNTVVYGHYNRDGMIEVARRSRACLYLSTDDRGPLAAAEIALAGCPLIGIERGCPWTAWDDVGVQIPHMGHAEVHAAIERAIGMDRQEVSDFARALFSTYHTVRTIEKALEPLSCAGSS